MLFWGWKEKRKAKGGRAWFWIDECEHDVGGVREVGAFDHVIRVC